VLRDAIGRDWQCGTVQVDLNMPGRLGAFYIDEHSNKITPVMLHRAMFGSLERFTGIMIEHYAGHLPLWLSPLQAVIATITSDADDYAREAIAAARSAGLRVEGDLRNEKINYKVREHSLAKVPVLLVVGRKEAAERTVSIRRLGREGQQVMPLDAALAALAQEAVPPDVARVKIRQEKKPPENLIDDLRSTIRSNVSSLFESAEILSSRGYYGPAVHLMMAAREECVKWVLIYCWDHLDNASRTKIFSHEFKHRSASIFYFMSGQLNALDFAAAGMELLTAKDPQFDEVGARFRQILVERQKDPESLADNLMSSLHKLDDAPKDIQEKHKVALTKLVDDAEKMRQNSIYVDFDKDLNVIAHPRDFGKDDYDRLKKDVILARFHIDQLAGHNPDKSILHSIFPEQKGELEQALKKLAADIEKA
jgi:AbiV family abortive infection protein